MTGYYLYDNRQQGSTLAGHYRWSSSDLAIYCCFSGLISAYWAYMKHKFYVGDGGIKIKVVLAAVAGAIVSMIVFYLTRDVIIFFLDMTRRYDLFFCFVSGLATAYYWVYVKKKSFIREENIKIVLAVSAGAMVSKLVVFITDVLIVYLLDTIFIPLMSMALFSFIVLKSRIFTKN